MKRQVDVILGESEVGPDGIVAASKELARILSSFLVANVEDHSPHPEFNKETGDWIAPGDPGYPKGWDDREEYDTSGEPDDLAHLRSKIFAWIEGTRKEIGSDPVVRKALDRINMSVRHHMRHETRDCLYNLIAPWNRMLDHHRIGQIQNEIYSGGEDKYVVVPRDKDEWVLNGWIDWLDT